MAARVRTLWTIALLLVFAPAALAHDESHAHTQLPSADRFDSAWATLRSEDDHQTFCRLAVLVGLHRVLDGSHDVTVFAPTNEAFTQLGEAELERLAKPDARRDLRDLIAGHLVWGRVLPENVPGWRLCPTAARATVALTRPETVDGVSSSTQQVTLLVVDAIDAFEVDCDASTGPVYGVDRLIRNENTEWHHAPGCEPHEGGSSGNGQHAGIGGGRSASSSGGSANSPDRNGQPGNQSPSAVSGGVSVNRTGPAADPLGAPSSGPTPTPDQPSGSPGKAPPKKPDGGPVCGCKP
ncbi:MAG: fasciclin domain-containing protein [Planctomycetota bacterium]